MSISTQTNWTLALFTTITVLRGTSLMAIEIGLDALPPVLFTALRYDTAGIALFGYDPLAAEGWRPRGRDEWLAVPVGGVLLIDAYLPLLFSGQWHVTSGVSAIVISLASVLTPLFAWPMLPEECLDVFGFLGALLGLVGTVIIAPVSGSVDGQLFGALLLFLAVTAWAFGSVLVKRLPGSPPVIPMQSWMMLTGTAMLYVTGPILGGPGLASVAWTPVVIVTLPFLVVLCSAVGLIAYSVLFDRIDAIEISLINYVTPAVVAVIGWAFLGERLGPVTVAGFALILAGFTFMKHDALGPLGWRFGIRVGLAAPASAADPDGLSADG